MGAVAVLDYGSGNIRSAQRALQRAGAEVVVTSDFEVALNADGLLVPGVGAFAACMEGLRAVRGDRIIGRRLAGGRPVLGICVGMQILFEHGVERGVDTEGVGEWPGTVDQLDADVLPHMGWNTVEVPGADGSLSEPGAIATHRSRLFDGIEHERFYFVHSYAARSWELTLANPLMAAPLVTWTQHGQRPGGRFVSAVENGPLSATQFHPEKSGDAGIALLRNWIETL